MISICLATYNGEKYLAELMDSVISQLRPQDELIISDDGSSDGTLDIIARYKNSNIRLYKNHFRDPVKNFEFLLTKVKGEIVVLCDQDDIWKSEKLEYIRTNLSQSSNKLLLFNAEIIDEKGIPNGETTFEKWKSRAGFKANLLRNTFMGSSMAFTADLLPIILPFPPKLPMHDQWIGLLAEMFGETQLIEKPLTKYRIHNNNTSLQSSSFSKKLRWRWNIWRAVLSRIKKHTR